MSGTSNNKNMIEQEIKEGNKLIAEFMGAKYFNAWENENYHYPHPHFYFKDKDYLTDRVKISLSYHASWDCLMPVVDKIHSLTITDGRGEVNFIVTIEPKYCVISVGGEAPVVEVQFDEYNQLGLVYEAATRFIIWYKSQPHE